MFQVSSKKKDSEAVPQVEIEGQLKEKDFLRLLEIVLRVFLPSMAPNLWKFYKRIEKSHLFWLSLS